MYCNLSHYIVIAIVRSDHRRESFSAGRRDMGAAIAGTEQRRAFLLVSPTGSQCLINWAGLYLERLERFSRRALISTISKINISIIIANIAKRYGTFMFISIPSTFLWAMAKVSRYTLYMYIYIYIKLKVQFFTNFHYSNI